MAHLENLRRDRDSRKRMNGGDANEEGRLDQIIAERKKRKENESQPGDSQEPESYPHY